MSAPREVRWYWRRVLSVLAWESADGDAESAGGEEGVGWKKFRG